MTRSPNGMSESTQREQRGLARSLLQTAVTSVESGLPAHPVRERSVHGEPKPTTSIERTCRACGASFLGLAPGKTGLRGIWTERSTWFCSVECAGGSPS